MTDWSVFATVIDRQVLAERRFMLRRLRVAIADAEKANTGDPMVESILAQLREQAERLIGTVSIRVQCMFCDAADVIEVEVDDPEMTVPMAMVCDVHTRQED